MFQSTLPRRERQNVRSCNVYNMEFQSTLPRRERLELAGHKCVGFCVSIHAPAKGATILLLTYQMYRLRFNPRSREGSDGANYVNTTLSYAVSIHAPAKGATVPTALTGNTELRFNPRSREGSDTLQHACRHHREVFQSTLPRRERPIHPRVFCLEHSFNPRSREGSDFAVSHFIKLTYVSIHAPAKGATKPPYSVLPSNICFNPRSREGSDQQSGHGYLFPSGFNPRSREGSDVLVPVDLT